MIMNPLNQDTALEIRYEKSIKCLLDLALDHSCERARVAANVLLSANNAQIRPHTNWMLHIPDLCHLDHYSLDAALGVIHGRVSLRRYPEVAIQNGPQLFRRLWRRWHNVEEW